MLRYHELVYEGYINHGETTYTSVEHAKALALGDQMGLHAIVDHCTGGHFTAAIEHSADGIGWVQKNATPEIDAVALRAGRYASVYGGEAAPTLPSMDFVRVRLSMTGARSPARVRLHAVLRERGKGRYSTCGCKRCEAAEHRDDGAHADNHVRRLHASRPHASMAELEKQLFALPMSLEPRERLRRALGALGRRERLEVLGFLQRAARASTASRRAGRHV